MENNKSIYLAKVCKLLPYSTFAYKYKKCVSYNEKIIVIESEPNVYREIITGIAFKKYPINFDEANDSETYVILDSRIDNLKEGFDIIEEYYNNNDAKDILHIFDWFNMDDIDKDIDISKRNNFKIIGYSSTANTLVRKKMKNWIYQ